jgi:hypothetical protein
MLFGDRGVFAIECELNEQIDGWVFGISFSGFVVMPWEIGRTQQTLKDV